MNFENPEGATPLTIQDLSDLKPKHIKTQTELNAYESRNILEANLWIMKNLKKFTLENTLNVPFLLKLHKKMFGEAWKWAGKFRQRDVIPGVDPTKIQEQTKLLLDDVLSWVAFKTYSQQEIAYRFHHRLVQIHPFQNGNGRHSRVMTDLLLTILGLDRFTWGSNVNLDKESDVRSEYINALRSADQGDYQPLKEFLGK